MKTKKRQNNLAACGIRGPRSAMRRLPLAVALFLFPGIAIWVERLTAGPPASYGTPPLVIDAFFQSAEYHGRFLP